MAKTRNHLTFSIFMLIVFTDLFESVAELFFKKGALASGIDNVVMANLLDFTLRVMHTPYLWIGVLFYICNFFFWILVLSKIDLSVAFPVGSTTYIIIPILSMVFLHENVPLLRWAGIAFIILGVFFVSKSTLIEDQS